MRFDCFLRSCSVLLIILLGLLFTGCNSDSEKVAEYLKKGMQYVQEKNEQAASIEFRNVIKIDPKNAEARYQLGLIYLKMGEAQKAFQQLQRTATLAPENLDAQTKTAEFYLLGRKVEESRRYITDVLKRDPEYLDCLALLGNTRRLV